MAYNKVSEEIIRKIRNVVGGSVVIEKSELEPYSHDETENLKFYPEIVVKSASTNDVSQVMKIANDNLIPVTPRGGGTGLSGGAIPVLGGVVLSLERMNHILEIDKENLVAVVEAGVILEHLQNEVAKEGLFFPIDMGSKGSAMIGGNIASCAGGTRAVKYGVMKDLCLGTEAVLANGEIIKTGGKLLKNVTGYNLTQLLVGSEGTLAIITKAIVRLVPLPLYRRTLLAPFDNIKSLTECALSFFSRGGVFPRAIEFMSQPSILAVEKYKNINVPYNDKKGLLLIDLDGNDELSLDREVEKIGEICLSKGAPDVLVASSEKQKFLWEVRHQVAEAVKSLSVYKEEDIALPRSKICEFVEYIDKFCEDNKIWGIYYGHLGDGNLHLNILKGDMPDKRWEKELPHIIGEIFKKVVSLGGTISGEHGIGLMQKRYLPIAIGKVEMELMRSIKRCWDPNNILNPDKIFPAY